MAYVTDALHGLARTAMIIGMSFTGLSLVMIILLLAMSSESRVDYHREVRQACIGIGLLDCLPGIIAFLLGQQVLRGRLWAAVALVTFAFLDSGKYILTVLLSIINTREGLVYQIPCDVVLLILSIVLLTRCSLAIPEIRRQMRAGNRSYRSNFGFVPLNTGTTPKPPPKSLKSSFHRDENPHA